MLNKIKYFILALLIGFTALMIPTLKSANAEELSSNDNYKNYTINLNDIIINNESSGVALSIKNIMFEIYYNFKLNTYGCNIDFEITIVENGTLVTREVYSEQSNDLTSFAEAGINYLGFGVTQLETNYVFYAIASSGDLSTLNPFFMWTYDISGPLEDVQLKNSILVHSPNSYIWSEAQKGYLDGFKEGKAEGEQLGKELGYQSGYNKGYEEGLAVADNDFFSLFTGIADTPFMIITSLLSFEIFGVSAFAVLFSILTVCIIIWLIKKFMV